MDPYAVCKYVKHYTQKNGYSPKRGDVGCTEDELDALVKNGVLEICPLYEGGPLINVVLTDKGARMSEGRR